MTKKSATKTKVPHSDVKSRKAIHKDTEDVNGARTKVVHSVSPGSLWPHILLGIYGCVATSLYIYTMYPSLAGGDSGEIIAAAHELGVAHPPGYPLFTLMLWATIKLIPVGTVVWRANLLNAVLSGLATWLYAVALYRYTRHVGCAICGAILWGFSKLTWTWATNAEVFGLNNLFLAALLYLMIVFQEAPLASKLKVSRLGAFVCGVSLCNQHTLILYVGVIAVWVLYELHQQKLLNLGVLIQLGLLGLIGMSPYIYLPVSAYYTHQRWTWGDQRTLNGFLTHFLRAEYGTFDLAKQGAQNRGESFTTNMGANLGHLVQEYTVFEVILSLLGAVFAIHRYHCQKERVLLVAMVMGLAYLAFFSWRANLTLENKLFLGVVERFWMQSDCVFILLSTVGLHRCLTYLQNKWPTLNVSLLGVAMSALIGAAHLQQNFSACNQRDNYIVSEFGLRLIDNLPENSTILTLGDLCSNVLRYFHLCENKRPDLKIFDQEIMTYSWSYPMLGDKYPHIHWPGNNLAKSTGYLNNIPVYDMKTFLDTNIHSGSIIGCIGMQGREKSWEHSYQLFPYGPCFLFVKSGTSFNADDVIEATTNMTRGWHYPVRGYPATSWEKVVTQEMWSAKTVIGLDYYTKGAERREPQQQLAFIERAHKIYKTAMVDVTMEAMPDHWHKNYALCCQKLLDLQALHNLSMPHLLEDAILHFGEYVKKNPIDKENPIIIQTIEHLKKYRGKFG